MPQSRPPELLGHQENRASHLSSFEGDALSVLDGGDDGRDGGRPTARQRQAPCESRCLSNLGPPTRSPTLRHSHWEAQLLRFQDQEVAFLYMELQRREHQNPISSGGEAAQIPSAFQFTKMLAPN